jgi:hypothetical protein
MLESTANNDAKIKTHNSAIKMLPGFIASVRVRCGKPNCRCSRGARHRAYYHVTYSRGFRLRKYVRRDEVAEARAACKAYRDLQAQLRGGRAEYKRTLARMRELIRYLCNE